MLKSDPERTLPVLHSLIPQLIQRLQAVAQPITIAPELSSSTEAEVLLEELRSKDRFLNNVVQELRMPLTNMIAALTLLNSPKLRSDQRQRYFNLLNNECNRQRSLIDSLLDLLELERTQEQVQLRRVLLSEVIPGVVSTYQPIAREKGITLGYTISSNLPPSPV
uniref:Histidine kinase dimerization/phospho-acceptor domain-containing protein n=1 Tax=Desertifilum tharense IPPAS B-1220 TaxID=1781255 RepID=A0ACD5GTA8_9CYAN